MYIHLGQPIQTHVPSRVAPISTPTPPAASKLIRVSNTKLPQFSCICRIVTHLKGAKSIGTGILINPYYVLTCAHVIYPPQAPQLNVKKIIIYPGQNGPDKSPGVRANGWAVSRKWSRKDCLTVGQDIGIIRLERPINLGCLKLTCFDTSRLVGAKVSLAGYPYELDIPEARHMYCSEGLIDGTIKIEKCTGDAVKNTTDGRILPSITEATDLIAHSLATLSSMSGAPMWIDQEGGRILAALHTGRISGGSKGKAVLINQAVRSLVKDWMTAMPPILPPR